MTPLVYSSFNSVPTVSLYAASKQNKQVIDIFGNDDNNKGNFKAFILANTKVWLNHLLTTTVTTNKRKNDDEESDEESENSDNESGSESEDEEAVVPLEKDDEINAFRNRMQIKVKGDKVPKPSATFYTMDIEKDLKPIIIKNIENSDWKEPTPIQMQAIPAILSGRDVLACAPTGSGKTAAL